MADSSLQCTDQYLLIAAIDFGTTYSGYAFSFVKEASEGTLKSIIKNIHMNKNWGAEMSFTGYKAPTSVLTEPDGKFKSFGFAAEKEYTSSCNEDDGYHLYRHFKMMLLKRKKLTNTTTISSIGGHSAKALDIFAMTLQYMKDHLLKTIRDSRISTLDNSNIKWVLTVPAIWKDSAKRFMRTACNKAGLISNIDSSQLVIALEPEAASLFCQSESALTFKPGEKCLIIDAGGGTLDITAHEILHTGDVKEIYPPSGGPWGGICADEAFEQLLKQIFEEDFITKYKVQQPNDWLHIMLSFEKSKSLIKFDESNNCNIPLNYDFVEEIRSYYEVTAKKFVEGKKVLGVNFRNGLSISPEVAKGLFDPVIKDITAHLQHLLDTYEDIAFNYVMLVGGFGQSNLLQNAVTKVFENKAKVVIPLEAQLAIVKGAVIYGYMPSFIKSRIAKYSYGYCVSVPFIEGKHNEKYKDNFRGKELCTNLFKTIITKDDEIGVNTSIAHKVGSEDSETTQVDFYSADNPDVMYADSSIPGVHKHGHITIEHHSDSCQQINIEIITEFGGTELLIRARDVESGKWFHTSIDFL